MNFYDQGYPADLLVRTMVSSIEIKNLNGRAKSVFQVNDPSDPSYADFLEFCVDLRNAQRSHALILDLESITNAVVYYGSDAKLPEIVSAIQTPGFAVTCDTNAGKVTMTYGKQNLRWRLGLIPGFTIKNDRPQLTDLDTFLADPLMQDVFSTNNEQQGLVYDLRKPEERSRAANKFANYIAQTNLVLRMRTFESAMFSVARQQSYFEQLNGKSRGGASFTNDSFGPCALIHSNKIMVRPAMTLRYSQIKERPERTLVELKHDKQTYAVSEFGGTHQNSIVFTILSYLYAQTSINTQNLPVQQTIRLQ